MNRLLSIPARDEAWAKIAQDPKMAELCAGDEFKFPLARGYYELWCACWDIAWDDGWDKASKIFDDKRIEDAYLHLSMLHSEALLEITELQRRLAAEQPSLWTRIKRWLGR